MKSPWRLIGFIILMASLASAFEVRYIGELTSYPITIFEQQYNKVEQTYKLFPSVSNLIPTLAPSAIKGTDGVSNKTNSNLANQQRTSNLRQVSSSKKNIISQSLITTLKQIEKRAQYSIRQIIQTAIILSKSSIAGTKCMNAQCFFQQHITDMTNLKTGVSFLLPGQLIQLNDPSDFSKGVQTYQSQEYTRNKLAVKILFNVQRSIPITLDPTDLSINNIIMNKLVDHIEFLNSRPIKLFIQYSHTNRLGIVLRRLGLRTKIYEMLRLASNQPTDQKENRKLKKEEKSLNGDKQVGKIVIILHQTLFSVALDLKNPAYTKNNLFFNLFFDTYSERMLDEIMGKNVNTDQSPPLVVTQTNFGRLLIFTLQRNMETLGMIDKLGDCFTHDKLQNYLAFSEIMSVISRQRPQYYHAGVTRSQTSTIRTIDWQDIFFPITAASISQLQPISTRATSLCGHPYVQTQNRFYNQYECKNKIELVITYLGANIILQGIVEPIRPEDKHPFNITHPGTFEISSLVGSQPFELNLVARSTAKLRRLTNNGASYGIKFFFMKKKPVYSIQAEFALLVNGEERLRHAIGNSRSDRQYRGVRIRIDPNHLVDMKILEDF